MTKLLLLLLLLLLLQSHLSHVRLCATPETAAYPAPRPWDSSGENTGVGCHFLLPCMKVKSEREVAQSYPTLCDPMDCSLPGSSIHGIFQARVLEWGAIAFSDDKGSSVQLSCSVMSDSLHGPHRLQHARPPCPSPTPGAYTNSCPSSW